MTNDASEGRPEKHAPSLVDELMPVYDVSDSVATVVEADVATTWDALMNIDLVALAKKKPMIGFLGALRMLPETVKHLVRGKAPPRPPKRLTFRDQIDGDQWIRLGERPYNEIALGLVGKFWKPVIEFAKVDASAFRDFSEPGYAKTIYSLSVRPIGERRTLLTAVMRTATTDERSRRWFRRYWTLGVGSGAHVLVNGVIDMTRELAEHRT